MKITHSNVRFRCPIGNTQIGSPNRVRRYDGRAINDKIVALTYARWTTLKIMATAKKNVFVISAIGYSGATWVNLVLASHRNAFTIGLPNKLINIQPSEGAAACLVHDHNCKFWPPFIKAWDRDKNLYTQLADYAGKDTIVVNNPIESKARTDLLADELNVKYIRLVRDGRANVVSYMRHHYADKPIDFAEPVRSWYLAKSALRDQELPADPACWTILKYEDLIYHPEDTLQQLSDFLGVKLPIDCLKYWQTSHHPVEGNSGTIDALREVQKLGRISHKRQNYYDLVAKKTALGLRTIDKSWERLLGDKERLAFDLLAGSLNERYGYNRDKVTGTLLSEGTSVENLCLEPKIYDFENKPSDIEIVNPGAEESRLSRFMGKIFRRRH